MIDQNQMSRDQVRRVSYRVVLAYFIIRISTTEKYEVL